MAETAIEIPAPVVPMERVRSFEFRSEGAVGDGRTLEGYAAVFNSTERIQGFFEDWDEQIARGAFVDSLTKRTPVMQFDHGRDPRTGTVPIASISEAHEDRKGLFVRARLFDNPVVEPVREAIAAGAITGMSIRFQVLDERVTKRQDEVDLRTILAADLRELGPVVFPAYDATTVSVRSLLAGLDAESHRALLRELAHELRSIGPEALAEREDLAGRPDARSAGGGDQRPGAAPNHSARARDRALRLRGILRA